MCVNCGENHTANFKGCKYYQDLKSKSNNNETRPIRGSSTTSDRVGSENTTSSKNVQVRFSSSQSYSEAARRTSSRFEPQTQSGPSVQNTEITGTGAEADEVNNTGPNIEQLIIDLVKSVMPIIKNIISNVFTSLFQNATV